MPAAGDSPPAPDRHPPTGPFPGRRAKGTAKSEGTLSRIAELVAAMVWEQCESPFLGFGAVIPPASSPPR